MIAPAVAARLADVLKVLDAPQGLLAALAAHGRSPDRFPAARLVELGPLAEDAGKGIRRARATLAGLLPDAPAAPASEGFDLAALSALEAGREDLAELRLLLGKALSVAERIDEARGRSYPDPIGGSCGFDLAEEVNQLLARVENELGPNRGTNGKSTE